jgi:hypothetical protein
MTHFLKGAKGGRKFCIVNGRLVGVPIPRIRTAMRLHKCVLLSAGLVNTPLRRTILNTVKMNLILVHASPFASLCFSA